MKRWAPWLVAIATVAGWALAGSNGVGSGGLQGFPPGGGSTSGAIAPSSVVTPFVDAGSVVAVNVRCAAANGADCISVTTTGARVHFGPGSTDYFTSNGTTTVMSAGNFAVPTNNFVALNGSSVSVGMYWDGTNTTITNPFGKAVVLGDNTSPARAAFSITPQDAEPTGANVVGDMYVTAAGVLKICTVAGTPGTWVSVGAQ